MGLFPENHGKVSSDSGLKNADGVRSDCVNISWKTDAQYTYALTGSTTLTGKSDAASVSHVRVYSAEMYDMVNNRSLGKQVLFKYDLHYSSGKARWVLDLDVTTPMVFN